MDGLGCTRWEAEKYILITIRLSPRFSKQKVSTDLGLQIAMSDTFSMHCCQSVEQLLDYYPRITFIPPVVIHKGFRDISYGHIFHSNVYVIRILVGGVEFDEPFVLVYVYVKQNPL